MATQKKKATAKVSSNTKSKKAVKNAPVSVSTNQQPLKSSPKKTEPAKISDSYVSLALGALVVFAIVAVVFIYVKESRKPLLPTESLNQSISPVLSRTPDRTHTMAENESLWDVAVKYYGDGYKYVKIIEVNKLENPDFVPPGTVIIIPEVK